MVLVETIILIIALAAVISSIDFIAKTTSNITHSIKVPEYLASTIVLSFVMSVPVILLLFLSNLYDVPVFGISVLIGFVMTLITLVMGLFLFFNRIEVEHEGHRNSTFMWAAALLFLIISMDKFIDRVDALFLLTLFSFYVLYMMYRTKKAREYIFLKRRPVNMVLYPLSLFTVVLSSIAVFGALLALNTSINLSFTVVGFILIGPLMALPMWDVIKNVFTSRKLVFDNMMGNIVIGLTLAPGIIAMITPIPLSSSFDFIPLMMLNVVCLSFAMLTRLRNSMHKRTGIVLIAAFVGFVLYSLFI